MSEKRNLCVEDAHWCNDVALLDITRALILYVVLEPLVEWNFRVFSV